MISRIKLVRNISAFDSVQAGAHLPLNKLSLIYAENSRGKTTLASIFRSLACGDPSPILERKRQGSQYDEHVVIADSSGHETIFENGEWTQVIPDIVVFDDNFVAENVCSGLQVESNHRQSLHELVIGAEGVDLNVELQSHVNRIEKHNQDIGTKGDAILQHERYGLTIDQFCALSRRDNIEEALQAAARNLAAARQSDDVRSRPYFEELTLPRFDTTEIEKVLARGLPNLESDAVARVREHFAKIGEDGETWVGDGMGRIGRASAGNDQAICPFCVQELEDSPLISHYQAYFSAEYSALREAISTTSRNVSTAHHQEVRINFERVVRAVEKSQEFWKTFIDTPEVMIDVDTIVLAWKEAFEGVSELLRAKQSSPLEPLKMGDDVREKIDTYHELQEGVTSVNENLLATRGRIDRAKERAMEADVATLETEFAHLKAVKSRFSPEMVSECEAYLEEKRAKIETEQKRNAVRAKLETYRNRIFPEYGSALNNYLHRFNAGFRLDSLRSINTRRGSTCDYGISINDHSLPLSAKEAGEPSFKSALSAGDRNALALAFFFASLDKDRDRSQRVVVIDDPMTSLDEHRALTTVQEVRRLVNEVAQVIVLSHSKAFLCSIWEGADKTSSSVCRIARENSGSTLAEWDIKQDSITEHDRRHELVRQYIGSEVETDEREVATALRPILESFVRVAYPECFPPGALLGPFVTTCKALEGTPQEVLSPAIREELRSLLDYANLFHHDANPSWKTTAINDQELTGFARRTLDFTRR